MVLKGQFLERATVIPVGSVVLDAVSHRGTRTPALVVIPPTPLEGGGMDHVVGAELAYAASAAGFPTLRFNFRGVGASQGERGQGEALLDDARAAVAHAQENVKGGPVVVASIGGGSRVAVALLREGAIAAACAIVPTAITSPPEGLWAIVGQQAPTPWKGEPRGVRLERVPGLDSGFQRGLPQVGKAVVEWLERASTA